MDISLKLLLLRFCLFIVIRYERKISLWLHSSIYNLCKFFLVPLFDLIYLIPGIIFNLVSLILVFSHHSFDLFLESVSFLDLLFKFYLLFLLELLHNLLMMSKEFSKSLFKLLSFILLLCEKFLISKCISLHFVIVVLLSSFEFNLMSLGHLLYLFLVHSLHFFLWIKECLVSISVFDFLILNFHLQTWDSLSLFA